MINDVATSQQLDLRAQPGCLQLAGEIDVSNVEHLLSALAAAAPLDDQLTVDLTAVSFIDLSSTRELIVAQRELLPVKVTVRNPPASMRTILVSMQWVDEIVLCDDETQP